MTKIKMLFLRDDSTQGKSRTCVIELAIYPEEAGSLQDAIALVQKRSFDLVISAYRPGDQN